MPRQLCEMPGIERSDATIRFFGLREIGAGVMIRAQSDRSRGLWSRVAGDGLDLAALAAVKTDRPNAVIASLAAVAGVTALDIVAAAKTTKENNTGLRLVA